MKVHLVGGFLGSGKTTAITNASLQLKDQGIIAGVVTNDQGNYLVDSKFIEANAIPSGQVTGGCFCCNFNDLDEQIQKLLKTEHPKVIFAESVGSCTDLIATVLKPLEKYRKDEFGSFTLSIFTDSRLLLKYLKQERLDFTDDISYIFEKQIEEANILIANKIDLLKADELTELKELVQKSFPEKITLFQNSLDDHSLENWLRTITGYVQKNELKSMDINYEVYGKGEAQLAWLDEEIEINGDGSWNISITIIENIKNSLVSKNIPIGHLKFLISDTIKSNKISFTTIPGIEWKSGLTPLEGNKVVLMVNARVQTSPENLRSIVAEIVNDAGLFPGIHIREHCVSTFQPGFPNPTHRIA